MPDGAPQQLLHLVIGGELTDLEHNTFKDLDKVDIVGVYPNYATALTQGPAGADLAGLSTDMADCTCSGPTQVQLEPAAPSATCSCGTLRTFVTSSTHSRSVRRSHRQIFSHAA